MKQLLDFNKENLFFLIKTHRDELKNNKTTELEAIINEINNSDKEVFEHFTELVGELSNNLNELEIYDLSSLLFFIEKISTKSDKIIWNYLAKVRDEENIERKTLLLKISYVLYPELITEELLKIYTDIKNNYPLFWYDLLFYKNQNEAINGLGEFIKEKNISFSFIYPVVNRWLRTAKNRNLNQFKNSIYSLESNFDKKDKSSFDIWLKENDINIDSVKKIFAFGNDINLKNTAHYKTY